MKDKDLIFDDKIKEFTTGNLTVKGFIVSIIRKFDRDMIGLEYREERDMGSVRVIMFFDKNTRKIIRKIEQLYGKISKEINYDKLENSKE
mgnify:CR=1 FL=1